MTLRTVRFASLLGSLLVFGCGSRPEPEAPVPESAPTEALPSPTPESPPPSPTPETTPPPPPPAPSALRVPIPLEVSASGARLVVARLHASRPAQEFVTEVAAGIREIEVPREADEVLAVSVLDREGRWSDAAMVQEGGRAWPTSAVAPRVLQVPEDYATLQAAVDAARAGDTVRVRSGTYRETVRLKSGIRLLGSGAAWTVLDGGGAPGKLVDFSGASDVVVAGFTFQNVGTGNVCDAHPVTDCAGEYYSAAVYADGHTDLGEDATSGLVMHNIFRGNAIGTLLYFHARAVVTNNLFVDNTHGFVANHFQDVSLLANNTFWNNTQEAIVSQAAYLDILNNVVGRSEVGVFHQYIQTGRVRCNLFSQNGGLSADSCHQPPRFAIGQDGNLEAEPRFVSLETSDFHPAEDSPLRGTGCFENGELTEDWMRADIGAYGGPLGNWQ